MSESQSSSLKGPALVAMASLLWATDGLFRVPAVQAVDPIWIVTIEHLIGVILLLPWLIWRRPLNLTRLTPRQWAAFFIIGAGASAGATILFTAAFRYTNPSVIILLQKLQPVLVVLLAMVFLRERPGKGFFLWAPLALFAAVGLSSPDLGTAALREGVALRSTGVVYALTAASIWALATVVGKRLLSKLSFEVTTFWRFVVGLATLLFLLITVRAPLPVEALRQPEVWKTLAYIGIFPGLTAMLIYYAGLKRTSASITTLVELLFPIAAVLLNALFLGVKLDLNQLAAGALLLFSITRVSLSRET